MSVRLRRVVWSAVGLLAASLLLVTAGIVWTAAPAHATRGLISFRLPASDGRTIRPDAADLAEAAPGDAPLLLFLPATGAHPASYTRFLSTARSVGYSVLGLDYWNLGPSLARSCAADVHCYGDMMDNRLSGASPTRFSRVPASDSIRDRLQDAIGYLCAHDAAGDWQRYRHGAGIRWSDVVVAGHSQGGGEAAYIGHRYRVRGVLMFSAPAQSDEGRTAAWALKAGATSASRVWALDDVNDLYNTRITPTWRALGISAARPAPVPIGAHGLLSSLDLGDPARSHGRVVSNRTPLGPGGEPVLAPTWRWMLRQAMTPAPGAHAPRAA